MKRRYKVLLWAAGTVGVAVIGLRLVLSHDSPCAAAPALAAGETPMKGWVHRCYGGPDIVQYEDLPKPVPADDEVIVKVRAASVNPLDWHYMRGKPYVMRMMGSGVGAPENPQLGVDFAGVVESVGKSVTKFKPGDEVFGGRDGAFSEYVRVRESRNIVMKPANISFEEAAAVPIAALTALQAVRDYGKLKAGEKVLVNGASGGVGTFAVQIAKAMGAEVTGVCSGRNVELVRSLGADHVIDYTGEDFTAGATKYDLIIDNVVTHSFSDYRRVLNDAGRFVIVGIQQRRQLPGAHVRCAQGGRIRPGRESGFRVHDVVDEAGGSNYAAGHAGGGEDPLGHRSYVQVQRSTGGDPVCGDGARTREGGGEV